MLIKPILFLGESGTHGYVEAIPCLYQFLCRAVVLVDNGNPFSVSYVVNQTVDITFLANIRGSLAIVSLEKVDLYHIPVGKIAKKTV